MTLAEWIEAQWWAEALGWAMVDAFPPVYESGCASGG